MKTSPLNSRKIEILLYGLIWFLVFSIPFFTERTLQRPDWNKLLVDWLHLFIYLIVFLVNVYLLVPFLLLRKRYLPYFTLALVILLVIVGVDAAMPEIIHPPGRPELARQDEIRLSRDSQFPENESQHPKPPIVAFLDSLILAILIVGAGTTYKLMSQWLIEEKLRKDIEKEQLKTKLAFLRHQVSPHFFMNTLNNIHTLVEIDGEKAQDAIERLSVLMRYLLYDSAQNTIGLKKEIDFINSFISLMQLRHSDEVEVVVALPEQIPDTQIPPMLFISLLENAFKHGVSYPLKSYIHFELRIEESSLYCTIRNSKPKIMSSSRGEYSGIGLDNIRKSLKLLYDDDDFRLDILDKETEFEVNLKIPV